MSARDLIRRALSYAGLLALVALLGWLDHLTGRDLSFFVVYFVPVSIAAYYLGAIPSLVVSFFCAGTWALSDGLVPGQHTSQFFPIWNAMIRLAAFVTIGLAISKISALLQAERRISEQLRAARAELKVLEGLLPICGYCKKIRGDDGDWEQLERYITQHSEARFSHGVCPSCKQKLLSDAGIGSSPPT